MSYAFLAHAKGLQGAASGAVNFSGVDLIVCGQVSYSGNAVSTISDSSGNTYTALTKQAPGGAVENTQLFYKQGPTVSSSMTFTSGNANADVYAIGFSGSTTSPFDVQNGNGVGPGSSVSPGSITPSGANYLVVVLGALYGPDGSLPVNSDGAYTTTDSSTMVSSVSFGGCFSYSIQTAATATNPLFTWSGSENDSSAVIASFKPATGGVIVNSGFFLAAMR